MVNRGVNRASEPEPARKRLKRKFIDNNNQQVSTVIRQKAAS